MRLGYLLVFGALLLVSSFASAAPQVDLSITYPAGNVSVNQYRFFQVVANVSCLKSLRPQVRTSALCSACLSYCSLQP